MNRAVRRDPVALLGLADQAEEGGDLRAADQWRSAYALRQDRGLPALEKEIIVLLRTGGWQADLSLLAASMLAAWGFDLFAAAERGGSDVHLYLRVVEQKYQGFLAAGMFYRAAGEVLDAYTEACLAS